VSAVSESSIVSSKSRDKRKELTAPTSRIKLRARDLVVDEKYRQIDLGRVKKMGENMDLDGLGTFTVSERSPGEYVVLDGQHRHRMLMDNEMGEWEVDCVVYHGLAEEDEARLFLLLNASAKPSPMAKYMAGVKAKDPECLGIEAILKKHGLKVTHYWHDGSIRAVQVLHRIYRAQPDGMLLDRTLAIALAVWGPRRTTTDGSALEGLSIFLNTYGDEVDLTSLMSKLTKLTAATRLIGLSRPYTETRQANKVSVGVAMAIVDLYNNGRRNRLVQLNRAGE
jgi:hypothetical protein